jgi:hypothetical protein
MALRRTILVGITSLAALGLAVPGGSGAPAGHRAPGARDRGVEVTALRSRKGTVRHAVFTDTGARARQSSIVQVKQVKRRKRGVAKRGSGNYRGGGYPVAARLGVTNAIGTITYDDGLGSTSFGGGAIIGNRFNTHTGIPVLASGTVSMVQAVVVPGGSQTNSSVAVVVLGPQTGGGGAAALFHTTVNVSGPIATVNVGGIGAHYAGNSFFAVISDFPSGYIPVFGTGTNLGQGHHGMVGYTGGMFPNITGTFNFGGSLNGIVRARGNIVPVELMKFEVE